ncbi:MAG: chromate efflux transporter [Crocinitomicaceae bacterium]|nr:chromate efflux transporter [Crocinitomicaceae bacterium]
MKPKANKPNNRLREVAAVFFKLGCFAFGGPAAHVAMMEEEVVSKRKWMTKDHFLDLMGATNLIPGPNSTEMTMHCGHERAGWKGLFVAGACFIFPAVLITGIFAWIYVEYGSLPQVEPFFFGVKPAVLSIILAAVIKLGKKALKNIELGILGGMVIAAGILGLNEVVALLAAGVIGMLYFTLKNVVSGSSSNPTKKILWPFLLVSSSGKAATSLGTLSVFLTFLKVGAILYGSGYVLFAYLDAELVDAGWLTRQQLLDAIAVGQFTPGPVLSTATFIGYQLDGFWGAIAATAGIFLPSFLFVLFLNPLIPRMRKSKVLGYFLDAVNVGAVGIMIVVLIFMTMETAVNWKAVVILTMSLMSTFLIKKSNAIWTIIGGAIMGYVLGFI